jgi:23S rRNA (cytosine1962-C5)-methyltransferase
MMQSMSASLKLKSNVKARVLTGHPWVFVNELEKPLGPEWDGEVVECRDRSNRLLGYGIYNSKSQICWRRISREKVALDEFFFVRRLEAAVKRRAELGERFSGDVRRVVWSESDGLPGLVVDQFGDILVVQIQSLAFEKRRELITLALNAALRPTEIVYRHDAPIRRLEGLPLGVFTESGQNVGARWLKIDRFDYWFDPAGAQKTGFYLDQREQHERVARYAKGRRVLDAFCNQGPFALHAARAGATQVRALDSADDAIAQARQNAKQNGVKAEFEVVNVFDYLNERKDETWDMIVLDPPPFAKSKSALEGALRGYKEINLRAMQRLSPGGILATYTCSHHMHDAELREVLADAAADAKRTVRVLEYAHQPPDHPVLVTMPESEYLRGYILMIE